MFKFLKRFVNSYFYFISIGAAMFYLVANFLFLDEPVITLYLVRGLGIYFLLEFMLLCYELKEKITKK